MKRDFAFRENSCPDIVHDDLLDGAEVFAFAGQIDHSRGRLSANLTPSLPPVVPYRVVDTYSEVIRTKIQEAWLDL